MKTDMHEDKPVERHEEGRHDKVPSGKPASQQNSAWGHPVCIAVCPNCEARFLIACDNSTASDATCPNCFQSRLASLESSVSTSTLDMVTPELVEPFRISHDALERASETFTKRIPLPPADLSYANLVKRLRRVFLPAWLVDATAEARWWTEAGYDYDVVSHVDTYDDNGGGWHSRQVTETRTRWEPRLGSLSHTFSNLLLPALEERQDLAGRVYRPDPKEAVPYSPQALDEAFVRLPDREHEDVWAQAAPQLHQLAAELCRSATSADHMRLFRWAAQYPEVNWTLLLSPLYTSYYVDDDGTPQPVCFHGATGVVVGQRRGSMRRAKHLALILVATGTVLFAVGLIAMLVGYLATAALLPVGGLVAIIGLLIATTALAPLFVIWHFNRKQLRGSHSVVRPNPQSMQIPPTTE